MSSKNMASDKVFQQKKLTFRFFLRTYYEGTKLVLRFWFLSLRRMIFRKEDKIKEYTNDASQVTLVCGFRIISRLSCVALLFVPGFILDLRLGLQPSRRFIISSYSLIFGAILVGIFISISVYIPILDGAMTDSTPESTKLIKLLSRITILAYTTLGVLCTFYLVWKRDFLYNFVVHQCANMSLPADYQKYQAAQIYIRIVVLSLLSEPIFLLSTFLEVFKQPKFLPTWSSGEFSIVRQMTLLTSCLLTLGVSVQETLIPICTQFLVSMSEAYTRELVDKQFSRIKVKQATIRDGSAQYDYNRPGLNDLLSAESQNLLDEISCTTLCHDWPQIQNDYYLDETEVRSESIGNQNGDNKDIAGHSSCLGSRIFLYKNLTKSLIELKQLIRSWENVFGIFHFMCVCVNGFMVAQWIVLGRAELRSLQKGQIDHNAPLFYRTIFSLLTFTLSNVIAFRKCDSLPQRMEKLRQKLFKLNLDLVEFGERGTRTLATQQEIELVWSLFDQTDRVIKDVNFRFSGKTFYSKRCLITIFSREASLILLYMQVIDIYSTV